MSEVRALLDRLADIETTIDNVGRNVTTAAHEPLHLTLQSLEMRRDELLGTLHEVSRSSFIDICDYRFISEGEASYTVHLVSQALRTFQNTITSITMRLRLDRKSVHIGIKYLL